MQVKGIIAAVVSMLGIAVPVFAESNNNYQSSNINFAKENKHNEVITLTDAAKRVLQHPRIRYSKSLEQAGEERVNIEESAYYPQIKGGLSSSFNNPKPDRFNKKYLQSVELQVKQIIYDFGKTASAVESAKQGHHVAQINTSLTHEELIYAATTAVLESARFHEQMNLAVEQVAQVQSLKNLVQRRYEKGASTRSDVLQIQARLDAIQADHLDVQAHYLSQLNALSLLIATPSLGGVSVEPLPTTLEARCSPINTWEQVPEYAVASAEALQARAELDREQAEALPTISLQASASRPLNATPRYGSRTETGVSLNVSMPFYQGGGLSASKRLAAGMAQAAEARKAEVQLEVEQLLSELFVRQDNLQARNDLLQQRVENIQGTKGLYKKQYLELGSRSLVDLLNAEEEYHQARVNVTNNKIDYIQTKLDCFFYKGGLAEIFIHS